MKSQNDIPNANTAINLKTPLPPPSAKRSQNVKLPPIYIHCKIDHLKLLDALKSKYQNAFQAKFTSDKLKMMFVKIKDFTAFKAICINHNNEFHPYTLTSEKTLSVVLKGLIRLPLTRISENIRWPGPKSYKLCNYRPTPNTSYIELRLRPEPQINHVRFIENIKIYWKKYESHKPTIQCSQAYGHTSSNCNKKPVCVALDNMTPDPAAKL